MASHAWRPVRPRAEHVHPRPVRTLVATLVAAVASLSFVGVTATVAHAQPTVAEIERQIDQAWHELEPLIEDHNATRQTLAANRKKADKLAKKIEPLQLKVDLAMGHVGVLAAHAYRGGSHSALNAMLTSGSPTTLVDQLSMLDVLAKDQREQVAQVIRLKQEYEAEKEPLDALIAKLTKVEAEQDTRAKEIDAEIDRLQKLRVEAYGTTGGIGTLRPAPCPLDYIGGAAGTAVKFACDQIGKPYYWGAAGPGSYDCSGLMLDAWRQAGVVLPHNAAQQRQLMPSVSRSDLRPGDLIFYNGLSHVGMYVGGDWMVHAPQAGDQVRMAKVDSLSIHSFGRPG